MAQRCIADDSYQSLMKENWVYKSCCELCRISDKEEAKHNEPLPWIGLYVAAASLVCSVAIGADVFLSFRHKKLWFPCKIFTLNAATLTLLAVAMKLPVDLSTSMPFGTDQFAKLSSTAFMCTVIAFFLPSLGQMGNREILMNIIALGILVVTVFVNLCIQLYTGIILVEKGLFLVEQTFTMFAMLILFVLLSFSALSIPATTNYMNLKYNEMHKKASCEEEFENNNIFILDKLKKNVRKYWMMAETSNPQFVMARSVTCTASGVISFWVALALIEVELRIVDGLVQYYIFSYGSAYRWSTPIIFLIQNIGVLMCIVGSGLRLLTTIKWKCTKRRGKSFKAQFMVEQYWTQRLEEWKEIPIALNIQSRTCRKLIHNTKNLILGICVKVQMVIVVTSKSIEFLSLQIIMPFVLCCHHLRRLKRKLVANSSTPMSSQSSLQSKIRKHRDLGNYVLSLEGENELPERMLKNIGDAVDRFIQMGRKQQPKLLIEFLKKSTGFNGVAEFDDSQVQSIDHLDPPNIWMLPVVTLSSIAIALPNIADHVIGELLCSVREGLLYIRRVEKDLDAKKDLIHIRNAAEVTWLEVELYGRWLDQDLKKMASKEKHSNRTLQGLSEIGKNIVMKFMETANGSQKENPLSWPGKVIAANSMYRISQTLLLDSKLDNERDDHLLFEKLSVIIADILNACLTNLPRVITMKCYNNATEKRVESVQQAAHLLGETEEILKFHQQFELPSLNQDQAVYIDEWREIIKHNKYPLSNALSIDGNIDSSSSNGISAATENCDLGTGPSSERSIGPPTPTPQTWGS